MKSKPTSKPTHIRLGVFLHYILFLSGENGIYGFVVVVVCSSSVSMFIVVSFTAFIKMKRLIVPHNEVAGLVAKQDQSISLLFNAST